MTKLIETPKHFYLYYYDSCPFCAMTRQAINKLDQEIELRNIQINPKHRQELIEQGGKPQVPCLRIDKANGESEWLYESTDIVEYLQFHDKQKSH